MSRLIIGVQPVREAIRVHGKAIEKLSVVDHSSSKDNRPLVGIEKMAQHHGIAVERVPRNVLDRRCRGGSHQGVIAVGPELRLAALSEVLEQGPRLVTLLDRITDPQNFGAIIRSSVAFGADAIVWPEHDSAPLSAATFRASAGAVEHAALCRVRSLPSTIQSLRQDGIFVVGLASEGTHALQELDLTGRAALVVGAEGCGLRKGVRSACDLLASLPTGAPLGTLNASVSIAIALYEARRQRLQSSARHKDGES